MADKAGSEKARNVLTERHLRLGRALLAGGPVTHADLLREIEASGGPPGLLEQALLLARFASEEDLIAASLARYRIPRIRLEMFPPSPEVLRSISGEVAVRFRVVPVGRIGTILVAATPHIDARRAAAVRAEWGAKVTLVLATPRDVEEALRAHYPGVYAWARAVPALRAGDLAPRTLIPTMGRRGDLPAWWRMAVVGEGPVIPPEAPEVA